VQTAQRSSGCRWDLNVCSQKKQRKAKKSKEEQRTACLATISVRPDQQLLSRLSQTSARHLCVYSSATAARSTSIAALQAGVVLRLRQLLVL
jgi:hypothetical protein